MPKPTRPCPYCEAPVSSARATTCASADCRRRWRTDYMREWQRRYREQAGEPYTRRYYGEGRREADRAYYQRTGFTERRKAEYQRREARKRGAAVAERFSKTDIFERDGWRCGICGADVDRTLRYPDPGSASLDHVVPLSKGGVHAPDNVRCSHLRCNVSRGNREVPAV